jgi:hypothetical protein
MSFVAKAKTICVSISPDVAPTVTTPLPDNYPSLEEKLQPMIEAGLTTGKVLVDPKTNTNTRTWATVEAAQEYATYISAFPETVSAQVVEL